MNIENPQDDTAPSTPSQELINQLSKEAEETYRQVQPILDEAVQTQRQLQPFFEGIDTLVSQVAQQFNDFLTEVAANATRQVNEFITQVGTNTFENLKAFYDLANQIREFEKAFRLAEGEAARILKKYKWFLTPSMPTDFMFQVVEAGSQAGNQRRKINQIFVQYYTSNNYFELERR